MTYDNGPLNATMSLSDTLCRVRSYANTAMRFHEPYEEILGALCKLGNGHWPGVVHHAIERAKDRITHLYTTRNAVPAASQLALVERSLVDLEATIRHAVAA